MQRDNPKIFYIYEAVLNNPLVINKPAYSHTIPVRHGKDYGEGGVEVVLETISNVVSELPEAAQYIDTTLMHESAGNRGNNYKTVELGRKIKKYSSDAQPLFRKLYLPMAIENFYISEDYNNYEAALMPADSFTHEKNKIYLWHNKSSIEYSFLDRQGKLIRGAIGQSRLAAIFTSDELDKLGKNLKENKLGKIENYLSKIFEEIYRKDVNNYVELIYRPQQSTGAERDFYFHAADVWVVTTQNKRSFDKKIDKNKMFIFFREKDAKHFVENVQNANKFNDNFNIEKIMADPIRLTSENYNSMGADIKLLMEALINNLSIYKEVVKGEEELETNIINKIYRLVKSISSLLQESQSASHLTDVESRIKLINKRLVSLVELLKSYILIYVANDSPNKNTHEIEKVLPYLIGEPRFEVRKIQSLLDEAINLRSIREEQKELDDMLATLNEVENNVAGPQFINSLPEAIRLYGLLKEQKSKDKTFFGVPIPTRNSGIFNILQDSDKSIADKRSDLKEYFKKQIQNQYENGANPSASDVILGYSFKELYQEARVEYFGRESIWADSAQNEGDLQEQLKKLYPKEFFDKNIKEFLKRYVAKKKEKWFSFLNVNSGLYDKLSSTISYEDKIAAIYDYHMDEFKQNNKHNASALIRQIFPAIYEVAKSNFANQVINKLYKSKKLRHDKEAGPSSPSPSKNGH